MSMSMSDGQGDQSANEGQGAESSESQGFVDSYLQNVPEDYRPHVEPYIRDVERNTNSKFEEHANYRKQWEPYEDLGLTEYDPEGLQTLLQFAEMSNDPEAFQNWWLAAGQEAGFLDQLQQQVGAEDDDDLLDDEGDEGGLDLESFKTALASVIDEKISPLQERIMQDDEQQEVDAANQAIDEQIEELKQQYGEFDEQMVYKLALAYSDSSDDPIAKGFEDYQQFLAQIENGTVERKISQPGPAEPSGPAATQSQAPKSWDEAKAMAKERYAQIQ